MEYKLCSTVALYLMFSRMLSIFLSNMTNNFLQLRKDNYYIQDGKICEVMCFCLLKKDLFRKHTNV